MARADPWSDLYQELLELEGYFGGLAKMDDGDAGNAGMAWARAALMRIHSVFDSGRAETGPDAPLAKLYELLARQYLRFGDWRMAADCYAHAVPYWGNAGEGTGHAMAMWLLAMIQIGETAVAARELAEFGAEDNALLRTLRALTEPSADLRPLVATFPQTRLIGADFYGYLASAVGRRLAGDGHLDEALTLLDTAADQLAGARVAPWVVADVQQCQASVLLAAGRHEQSRRLALAAWTVLDSARYQACSHRQRRTTWRYFAPARYAALRASVALGDERAVAELIERCRLQSVLAVETEADIQESKERFEGANLQENGGGDGVALPDDQPHVGMSLFAAIEDAYNSTRLISPEAVAYGSMALPDGVFWSTHIENGMLFWFLAVDGRATGHGLANLRDHANLQPVLRALAGSSDTSDRRMWSLPPYVPEPGSHYEPVQNLAAWNSPEDRIICGTVGRLLPDPLVTMLGTATRTAPLALTVAASVELATVLWPITLIPGTEDRLVERAVLRMWTSSAIERGRARSAPGGAAPFLLACEIADGTLLPRPAEAVTAKARVRLSGSAVDKETLVEALREVGAGTPGLFFYSGHGRHDVDPAWSALPLSEDEALQAGEFFGTLDDGTPFLPMPTMVILACCSSSGNAMLGGATIGLVAGIIRSGAQQVIATGIDVIDSPFTQAFDDLLVDGMLAPDADAAALLRATQLRMLDEWKVFSVRGGVDYTEAIKDPHPIIWAAYQAI